MKYRKANVAEYATMSSIKNDLMLNL